METIKVRVDQLTTQQKFQILRYQLSQDCLEREYEIDALLALFICKQHGLLLGPPGTGKTMLLELLCKVFHGADYFSLLVGADTKAEDFFGVVSLNKLREEEVYQRNTKNRLPEAILAYLDEIFKCPTPILNQLLKVINERIYFNPNPYRIPLRTMVGSSNEIPDDSAAGALVDRFTWKCWVGYLQQDSNVAKLWERSLDGYNSQVTIQLPLEDLDRALLEARMVEVKHLIPVLQEIKFKLKELGYIISDRRWIAILQFLQAFAWVRRKNQVTLDELETVLADCIWEKPEQRMAIAKIIKDACKELNNKIHDMDVAIIHEFGKFTAVENDPAAKIQNLIDTGLEVIQALDKILAEDIPKLEAMRIFAPSSIEALKENAASGLEYIELKLQEKNSEFATEKIDEIKNKYIDAISALVGRTDPDKPSDMIWFTDAETLKENIIAETEKMRKIAIDYSFLADAKPIENEQLIDFMNSKLSYLRNVILVELGKG